jgi:hypothetical protein
LAPCVEYHSLAGGRLRFNGRWVWAKESIIFFIPPATKYR